MRHYSLLRKAAFLTALCFAWSFVLASTAFAATYREPVPPGRTRSLSAAEMKRIVGASAILGGDPDTGGNTAANVGASPGSAYPWEGSVGDVKTDNGNKLTTVLLWGSRRWAECPFPSACITTAWPMRATQTLMRQVIFPPSGRTRTMSRCCPTPPRTTSPRTGATDAPIRFAHNMDGSFTAPAACTTR